jgi:TRAP-type mannitol/chloroaromatic compound transport system permease small subunit
VYESCVIAALFVKLSLAYVMQSYSIDERSADPGGIPYRWAVKALIPIGYGLLVLQTAAATARLFLNERQRQESARV